MGAEKRSEARTRAHWAIELQWADGAAKGMTENLSSRGTMVSMEDEPPVSNGEQVALTIQLPGRGRAFGLAATVRWVSEWLPNTLGIEFDEPLPDDALGVLEALVTRDATA